MDGFKKTKLGWIPVEWEVVQLGDIALLLGGYAFKSSKMNSIGGNYQVIKMSNIYKGNLDLYRKPSFINEITDKEEDYLLGGNDIIMSLTGTVGKRDYGYATLINKSKNLLLNQRLCKFSTKSSTSHFFLYYILQSEKFLNTFYFFGKGGTGNQSNVGTSDLKKIKIPLPPLEEQKAIANCLGQWDKAIQLQQELLAEKEQRKKWLLQVLLTGKKRLPGFVEDWQEVKIKDFAKHLSIKNKANNTIIVLSCTKYDGLVPSLEYFGRKVYGDDLSKYKIVPQNHFAYATNHIEEGSIGYQPNYTEGLVSPMYTVFKTDKSVHDSFLFRVLKSHRLIYEYNARMEGSIDRRGGLRWTNFSLIKLKLPPLKEQTAIAAILNKADEEIALQKEKLAELEEQKKGMMQQLLTGKKRLV